MIQCGIPKSDKAETCGYQFPNEICLPELNHNRAGMVNMANRGPHTNAIQWCIMLGDRSYLNGDYTVIVPADQAYRTSGFYTQERKGKKRFVLSPNTILVYDVELIDIL